MNSNFLRIVLRTILGIFGLCLLTSIQADPTATAVQVEEAYARAVPPGQPNSAAYMVLRNTTATVHTLVAAKSPIANAVELHTHSMDGGLMRMRQVDKIDVPAGESVKLQPGGLHLMLIGLVHQLVPEEKFPVTLIYGDGAEQTIQIPVGNPDSAAMEHHGHHNNHH